MGATGQKDDFDYSILVSILTHPEGWALLDELAASLAIKPVSILTHPEGWALHLLPLAFPESVGFNPHPPRRVGATVADLIQGVDMIRFNPHPPRRVGATHADLQAMFS